MAKLTPFTMPKWGIEMAEGTIAEWMVAENEPFTRGTVLTLIETDKITNEVEAEREGRFVRILAEPGQTYPVGALLAVLSDGGEATATEIDALIAGFTPSESGFGPDDEGVAAPAPAPGRVEAAPARGIIVPEGIAITARAREEAERLGVDVTAISGSGREGKIFAQDVHQAAKPEAQPELVGVLPPTPHADVYATPVARRIAANEGVDLASLAGSGPRGRVRKADVLAAMPKPAPPLAEPAQQAEPQPQSQPSVASSASDRFDVAPMSSMRRTIARRLSESKQQIPHFYVRRRVRADRLLALRAGLEGERPSVNDYLIRACALALMEVPAVNIQVHGNDIHRYAAADISVAVATEKGLVTPIMFNADDMSVAQISAAMKGLAQKARSGKLKPEEFTGGSFSLSNLGGFGVEQFDAIINPPQGAILAVGTARPEPIDDGGAIRIVPVLNLSVSCDHRAIDGADGGRFMAALANLIEQPHLL
ncbi:dihydrolipoamide acetyltransferase family protein [Novosphingobium sp. PY1]|uniref:dihydrolipoamide acetyltransferase family protein n=1 Tax=Novosphingobium sp. PY1 TaxID=1882221 RepID=UPI000BE789F4|nr:dihydrolipoamide acetyltransferase family protein [Novosphingobium sp. PY1]BBA74101.1 pyruvate dehydrogenase E2 component [Novosphingobium sp. PY1]GFM31338.1 pyruvate dehydrogenase E2 component (dihydrolipoamide acetyltransferase) [Novosphingobium sp. PY1]